MTKLTPKPHQIKGALELKSILNISDIAYLNWEERTGKTLTVFTLLEKYNKPRVLIATPNKRVQEGWKDAHLYCKPQFVTHRTFHKAPLMAYDFIIIDEAHTSFAAYPKPTNTYKEVKRYLSIKNFYLKIILISATPFANSFCNLFYQFRLANTHEFSKYKNFYEWFSAYGLHKKVYIGNGLQANNYDEVIDIEKCKKLFYNPYATNRVTRADAGFKELPTDKLHYIQLNENTKKLINLMIREFSKQQPVEFTLDGKLYFIANENSSERGHSIAMAENGVIKAYDMANNCFERDYIILSNEEKIDYIRKTFGDKPSNIIMCYYKKELEKLKAAFKHNVVVNSETYAEGVDLSMYDNLIITSQSWKPSKFIQRRARQCNMNREKPIIVHFLLVKGLVSDRVYDALTNKMIKYNPNIHQLEIL